MPQLNVLWLSCHCHCATSKLIRINGISVDEEMLPCGDEHRVPLMTLKLFQLSVAPFFFVTPDDSSAKMSLINFQFCAVHQQNEEKKYILCLIYLFVL